MNESTQLFSNRLCEGDREVLTELEQLLGELIPLRRLDETLFYDLGFTEENGRVLSLKIVNRDINRIPFSICKLSKMKGLWISDTCLSQLPDLIGSLPSLIFLNLSRNRLKSLPKSIMAHFGSKLEVILMDNKITYIPETFEKISPLIKMDLRGNPLEISSIIRIESKNYDDFMYTFPESLTSDETIILVNHYLSDAKSLSQDLLKLLIENIQASLHTYILSKLPLDDQLIHKIEKYYKIQSQTGSNLLL